jgi:L-2-hydroxyglutarate oxidase LhgO
MIDADVAVIGGGVVGCAVARELAGYQVSVALLEARGDVGDGTSKANTAILHTGFDATPGSLESELVARGYALLSGYSAVTGIPVERTGAVLVAWTSAPVAESADVVIVGGGPAGLTAARCLRSLGVPSVLVLEREAEAGGIPRHSDHLGYGVRDLRTLLTGPGYARCGRSASHECELAVVL